MKIETLIDNIPTSQKIVVIENNNIISRGQALKVLDDLYLKGNFRVLKIYAKDDTLIIHTL